MAYVLLNAATIALMAAALVVMVYLYLREKNGASSAHYDARQDLANTMILLQTMRDVLDEQKELARAVNESLDKKIAYIRKAVDEIAAERQRLRDAQAPLGDAGADGDALAAPPETAPTNAAPLHVFPDPEIEADPDDDFIDGWAGMDLGPGAAPLSGSGYEPVSEEEARHARDAVRSLLDFCGGGAQREEALVRMPASGNGASAMPPALHSRVYEYHDAGMTVPQIAQELGIGKGEIRLMLSLRKDRER